MQALSQETLDEVIKDRKGDCDDISRILVNLLHYYGIPAVMVSGYVFINGFEISIPLENVTYVFNNNGPHAYVMAYLLDMAGYLSTIWQGLCSCIHLL